MYVMLFNDEIFPARNEYVLVDTDKAISELGDFTTEYIENHTQLTSPVKYGESPVGNSWHSMAGTLPFWYVDHHFTKEENKNKSIDFTFYQPPIIDDGGDTYYLVLLRKDFGHPSYWDMIVYKTNQDVASLAMNECKKLYNFTVTNYNTQTRTFFNEDNMPIRFIKFKLDVLKA
jgi:hypothetical protein